MNDQSPTDTHHRELRRYGRIAALALLLALLMLGSRALRSPEDGEPAPASEPRPAIVAILGEVRTVPDADPRRRTDIGFEVGGFLEEVYERAFLPPLPAPTASPGTSPEPAPIPRLPVTELFTDASRAALDASPDVYRPGDGVTVTSGRVVFDGLATLDGDLPVSALVRVTFEGLGRLGDLDTRITQTGELLLVRAGPDWRIGGFDLALTSEREVAATPAPSPQAVARWMP